MSLPQQAGIPQAPAATGGSGVSPPVISTFSALGAAMAGVGMGVAPASQAWSNIGAGAANAAIFIPFTVPDTITIAKLAAVNGTAVAGNVDMGIYSEAGNRLVSRGTTAQAGTSSIQEFPITPTTLAPGRYYLALAEDNAAATFLANAAGSTFLQVKILGVQVMTTAFPLPAVAIFSALTIGTIPYVMAAVSPRTVLA